jgi:hypothetical protein
LVKEKKDTAREARTAWEDATYMASEAEIALKSNQVKEDQASL